MAPSGDRLTSWSMVGPLPSGSDRRAGDPIGFDPVRESEAWRPATAVRRFDTTRLMAEGCDELAGDSEREGAGGSSSPEETEARSTLEGADLASGGLDSLGGRAGLAEV